MTSSLLRASSGNDTSQFICQNEDTNLTSVTFLVTGHLDYLLEQLKGVKKNLVFEKFLMAMEGEPFVLGGCTFHSL